MKEELGPHCQLHSTDMAGYTEGGSSNSEQDSKVQLQYVTEGLISNTIPDPRELTCDMGVNVGWHSSFVSCCTMPHSPNSSTHRSAGRMAAPPADKVSTAAFKNKGADMPAGKDIQWLFA
eukprot:GHUV01048479.1.p2 GENE.GHUV01048479.1~~GHUV01048479.1.p2  ORF type:complete len:120 (+),score=32.79 GHUV01048479.1:337-696(+)